MDDNWILLGAVAVLVYFLNRGSQTVQTETPGVTTAAAIPEVSTQCATCGQDPATGAPDAHGCLTTVSPAFQTTWCESLAKCIPRAESCPATSGSQCFLGNCEWQKQLDIFVGAGLAANQQQNWDLAAAVAAQRDAWLRSIGVMPNA